MIHPVPFLNDKPRNRTAALSRSKPETLHDDEFGVIVLRRNARAKYVRLRMEGDGQLVVTLPRLASQKHAEQLVESSRSDIRSWQRKAAVKNVVLHNGDRIGQSHTVHFTATSHKEPIITTNGLDILVKYPGTLFPDDPSVQRAFRPYVQKALQKEARAYLPRRLKHLASEFGFHYERVRFGTQKGRWGSCSSRGTISLNVGLMLLDPELIDYVLIHELCHTQQMNHSAAFWSLVESCLPDYKARRKLLKSQNPNL